MGETQRGAAATKLVSICVNPWILSSFFIRRLTQGCADYIWFIRGQMNKRIGLSDRFLRFFGGGRNDGGDRRFAEIFLGDGLHLRGVD